MAPDITTYEANAKAVAMAALIKEVMGASREAMEARGGASAREVPTSRRCDGGPCRHALRPITLPAFSSRRSFRKVQASRDSLRMATRLAAVIAAFLSVARQTL